MDSGGAVEIEEFLMGCLRLRGNAAASALNLFLCASCGSMVGNILAIGSTWPRKQMNRRYPICNVYMSKASSVCQRHLQSGD